MSKCWVSRWSPSSEFLGRLLNWILKCVAKQLSTATSLLLINPVINSSYNFKIYCSKDLYFIDGNNKEGPLTPLNHLTSKVLPGVQMKELLKTGVHDVACCLLLFWSPGYQRAPNTQTVVYPVLISSAKMCVKACRKTSPLICIRCFFCNNAQQANVTKAIVVSDQNSLLS